MKPVALFVLAMPLLLVTVAGAAPPTIELLVINGCGIWPHAQCRGADLRHADLAGKNLAGADLTGANLVRADLRGGQPGRGHS
jgi:hypothetical protein